MDTMIVTVDKDLQERRFTRETQVQEFISNTGPVRRYHFTHRPELLDGERLLVSKHGEYLIRTNAWQPPGRQVSQPA